MKKILTVLVSTFALLSLSGCTHDENTSSEQKVQYKVIFRNYDDTFLYETMVYEGREAKYSGKTPTREVEAETDDFYYKFAGWDKDISCITSDLTTKATFEYVAKEDWGPITWL